MFATEDSSYSLPVAPPTITDWPSRHGKPRVDLTQLHVQLANLELQHSNSLDCSTTTDTETPLDTTPPTRQQRKAVQPLNQHRLKQVRFSEEPPTIIVYEQVDILEGETVTRKASLRRRNVDLSPIKNQKYEGSFSSSRSTPPTTSLLGAATIDLPIKGKKTKPSSVKPLDIIATRSSPMSIETPPSTPPWSPGLEALSPSTSSDSSFDTPLTPTSSQGSPLSLTGRRMSKLRTFLSIRRPKGQQAF
ncbi:hypothetical protein BGW37DRAFT_471415 [Umbelopsis sp. PMI_123]|nr:hypothetical protein BGW37DRAFT_471415 [Umbelopsis sp. PMI_123]